MTLTLGAVVGAFNGAIIVWRGVAPFIVTLATMAMASGAALTVAAGKPIGGIGGSYAWLGSGFIGPVPIPVVIMLATFLLFPAVITVIVGFFLEEVVSAVESRHYPNQPAPRPQPLSEVLAITLKFALIMAALNLLILPIWLILFFLMPPLALVLSYLLNGYLISREYYELVALRRADPRTAKRLRHAHRGRILLAGVILYFIMTIPIINFVTPVLATAFMVHVFQGLPRRRELMPDASGLPSNIA